MKSDAVQSRQRASEKAGKAMKKQQPITLWSVIESMQRRLEKQGMDAALVDATITRRLRAKRYNAFNRLAATMKL